MNQAEELHDLRDKNVRQASIIGDLRDKVGRLEETIILRDQVIEEMTKHREDLNAAVDRHSNLAQTYFKISHEQAETIERQQAEIRTLKAGRAETLTDLLKTQKLCVTLEFDIRAK